MILPKIKVLMALIASVHDAGLPAGKDLHGKGSFTGLAITEIDFSGYGSIQIEGKMELGFSVVFSIVGPIHRKSCID